LNGPQGCAVDDALNVYVADTLNNRITLIDASGKMSLIAGGGSAFVSDGKAATTALLAFPVGIATDNKGTVYFTDRMGLIKQLTAVATK
jgi:DNA-binding beta-propeller fold protein YncE